MKQSANSFYLACTRLNLPPSPPTSPYKLSSVTPLTETTADLTFTSSSSGNSVTTGPVPSGPGIEAIPRDPDFILSPTPSSALTQMLQSHVVGSDILLLSSKGGGKSSLSREFCSTLGYSPKLFTLYKDLSSRDLLQRRSTDTSGSTSWEPSPLIEAALEGQVCVLDGVEKLSAGALKTLQQLCVERECFLPDGTRLVRHDRYDSIEDASDGVGRIHPGFRVVALGTVQEGKKTGLLDDDLAAMFRTVHLPDPGPGENKRKGLHHLSRQQTKKNQTLTRLASLAAPQGNSRTYFNRGSRALRLG